MAVNNATIQQARDADKQIVIGWFQAAGVGFSLIFSALAVGAALVTVKKASDTLDETKRMNAAIVRPIVAIETASIGFDLHTYQPKITLVTRNASDFTAHD